MTDVTDPKHPDFKSKYRRGRLYWGQIGAPIEAANGAPRCGARCKRTKLPCKQPAIKGKKRCRLHGGLSTGPKTAEGKAAIAKAHYVHGYYSKQQTAYRKWWRENVGGRPSIPFRTKA